MLGTAVESGSPGIPGFFGKLAGFGDFITRRLPRSFLDPWDAWLQQCILGARERLGAGWLDTYLTSPIWRFAIAAGVCGPVGWTGVVMPSVDRVGRHFPLTVAAQLPGETGLLALLAEDGWFEQLEELSLSSLDEPFDLALFDQHLEGLTLQTPGNLVLSRYKGLHADSPSWCFGLGSAAALSQSLPAMLDSLFGPQLDRQTFWWTSGSDKVRPCLLTCRGLPNPAGSAAFLDGNWVRWGWMNQP